MVVLQDWPLASTLTLIHLISIPVTNTSVNLARSISQAVFVGGWAAVEQLWLFILAPIYAVLAADGGQEIHAIEVSNEQSIKRCLANRKIHYRKLL